MQSKLTVLIPGLLQPPQSLQGLPAAEKPAFRSLNRYFARAKHTQLSVSGYYQTLFHLFGVDTDEFADQPVAALTYQVDAGSRADGWCLRCDPVYIHADMDRAVLMGHGALGLTVEETEQLVMIINAHVAQDGWQVEAHAVDRWYVRGLDRKQIRTTPPQSILGQDIKYDLPKGQDGSYWCSIMNECQMLLHELPVNQDRQSRGLPPINSLWFWGGGELPTNTVCQYDRVFANDPLVEGLAMMSGCVHGEGVDVWQAIWEHDAKHYLLVIDELISPGINGDLFAWLDTIQQVEQHVIQKIIQLLKDKQLGEVTVLSADGQAYQLTPSRLRQWWKRQAIYSSLIEKVTS
jgi:hypothetical protein